MNLIFCDNEFVLCFVNDHVLMLSPVIIVFISADAFSIC